MRPHQAEALVALVSRQALQVLPLREPEEAVEQSEEAVALEEEVPGQAAEVLTGAMVQLTPEAVAEAGITIPLAMAALEALGLSSLKCQQDTPHPSPQASPKPLPRSEAIPFTQSQQPVHLTPLPSPRSKSWLSQAKF